MNRLNIVLYLAVLGSSAAVSAQTTPGAATTPTAPASANSIKHYSTGETEIGTLLDDPAARALLDKHIPDIAKSDQVDMARSMTLKSIQQYSPDVITDKVLAALDTDLQKIPAK